MRTGFGVHEVRYRVTTPLMLLAFGDNHDKALPAAPGLEITVRTLSEDDRFVLVTLAGQAFHAFAEDVAACCEPIRFRRVRPLAIGAAA